MTELHYFILKINSTMTSEFEPFHIYKNGILKYCSDIVGFTEINYRCIPSLIGDYQILKYD